MYNNNNNNGKNNHPHYYNNFPSIPPSISPRISFSNDFVESQSSREARVPSSCPEASAAASDFEFSVSNHSMTSADELFFKGRILPSFGVSRTTTLREELLVEDDKEGEASSRPPKCRGSGRWKGLLGLRKGGGGGQKGDSSRCEGGSGDRVFDNNSSQEMQNDGIVNKFK